MKTVTYTNYKQALAMINDQKAEAYAQTKEKFARIHREYMNDTLTAREALDLYNEAEQEENRKIDELNQAIDNLPDYE